MSRHTLHRTTFGLGCLALVLSASCAAVPPVGSENNRIVPTDDPGTIAWPARYLPEDATFYVRNEIEIAAPPEAVWAELVQPEAWPAWYDGASDVELEERGPHLREGASFRWNTMGFRFESRVHEFEPPYRLAWETRREALQGYHTWLLVRTPTGTRVLTEESQFGLLAWLQKWFQPNKLRELHDRWLEALRERTEASRLAG
jgi:uncharacterized protein YndB with AHSA1/START domain